MKPSVTSLMLWTAGLAASLLLAVLFHTGTGGALLNPHPLALVRWVHVTAGILWVGLLYYFVFVQMPALAAAAADTGGPGGAGILRYIVPRALAWFRWASLVTWLTGAIYLVITGRLLEVFTLGFIGGAADDYGLLMGIGAWLGTLLLINVWLFILPNQRKILTGSPGFGADEVARAKATVARVARINAVISVPMLMFMVAATHGTPF